MKTRSGDESVYAGEDFSPILGTSQFAWILTSARSQTVVAISCAGTSPEVGDVIAGRGFSCSWTRQAAEISTSALNRTEDALIHVKMLRNVNENTKLASKANGGVSFIEHRVVVSLIKYKERFNGNSKIGELRQLLYGL